MFLPGTARKGEALVLLPSVIVSICSAQGVELLEGVVLLE